MVKIIIKTLSKKKKKKKKKKKPTAKLTMSENLKVLSKNNYFISNVDIASLITSSPRLNEPIRLVQTIQSDTHFALW